MRRDLAMIRRCHRVGLAVTLLVVWQSPVASQSLPPGTRVRVTAPEAALNLQPGQLLWLDLALLSSRQRPRTPVTAEPHNDGSFLEM